MTRPSQDEADRIIDYALTICMYGERAPGGDENWRDFGVMAENYLRRSGCAKYGHTPTEPSCPDCQAWEPTGWWRAVGPDGKVWCESSIESEVRQRRRDTDTIQRQTSRAEERWEDA